MPRSITRTLKLFISAWSEVYDLEGIFHLVRLHKVSTNPICDIDVMHIQDVKSGGGGNCTRNLWTTSTYPGPGLPATKHSLRKHYTNPNPYYEWQRDSEVQLRPVHRIPRQLLHSTCCPAISGYCQLTTMPLKLLHTQLADLSTYLESGQGLSADTGRFKSLNPEQRRDVCQQETLRRLQ